MISRNSEKVWRRPLGVAKHGVRVIVLIATLIALAPQATGGSENVFVVDESVEPIFRQLQPFEDGKQRLVAVIEDTAGRQNEFVEDEVLVATESTDMLNAFLLRWQGKILASFPPKENGKSMRYLMRINPDSADINELERWTSTNKHDPQAHYRVSSKRGLRLLAAVMKEQVASQLKTSTDRAEYRANWLHYNDLITADNLDKYAWFEDIVDLNCAYLLREEIRLLRELFNNGPNAAMAEQRLLEQIPNERCAPPVSTFNLTNGLVFPEVEAGSSFAFILQPPANIPSGFSAEIVGAQGGFVAQPPWGGTLYGGSVYLNSDRSRLVLATQPTFSLPQCARSETFTVRLTHANGSSDFQVILPVRLQMPGIGVQSYYLRPGENYHIPLCAAGERGGMQWSWDPISGGAFPPPGLNLVTYADGDAALNGIPQVNNYQTQGDFRVQQGNKIDTLRAQIFVSFDFAPILGTACANHRVIPGVFFQCQLPRPIGYSSHTWSTASGSLPAGTSLVHRGSSWYVEGTVPFSISQCPLCTPVDTLGLYTVGFDLSVPGYTGVAATRQLTLDVGVPFRVWTQNMILRPSALPSIANTADDNEERTQMLLDRINALTFDLIALQEVFDEEQRDQLTLGYSKENYNLLWGPDESDINEESGLALIVKGNPSQDHYTRHVNLSFLHHQEFFANCDSDDCWANKGFSVSAVRMGSIARVWVINTHLQAGEYSDTRLQQLTQMMAYVSTLPADEPVLLLGDLNIVAGQQEYVDRMGDALSGWGDLTAGILGNPSIPLTSDKTRNAYSHFWDREYHIFEHELEDIALQSGTPACESVAPVNFKAACSPPIDHPSQQGHIDYILVRQGTTYNVVIDSARLEDGQRTTDLCRDQFQQQYSDAGHGNLRCYLSDHFGLSAELRLVKR
jgi:endonuclease/exonuclease/phosphatase family metal-dependent hydrolase